MVITVAPAHRRASGFWKVPCATGLSSTFMQGRIPGLSCREHAARDRLIALSQHESQRTGPSHE
jgi:hypothetical protein